MKVAIVGAGKLGLKVANALEGGDYDITIVDKNEERLHKMASQLDVMTVTADARQASILKELHMASYDFLLACTNNDETNIIIASFAKNLGCDRVMARVREPEYLDAFAFIRETMNINYITNPDYAITLEIYKYLVEKYSLNNAVLSNRDASLLEFNVNKYPKLVGMNMIEVNKELPGMLMIGISRHGKVIIPHGPDVVQEGDLLYVIGKRSEILSFGKKVHEKGKYTSLQKVLIIGGGKTGFFLARKLTDFNVAVKIIEKDKERCYYLAEHLDNVMVLHGDGTDINLLEEENLEDMDAVVTATGFDEDNLLLALMAKNKGIEDVIAKVSRSIYADMIAQLGVNMALNPQDIAVTNILRDIKGKGRIITSELIQGQAEISEITIGPHMKLSGKPLKDLNLNPGMLIGAVHRGQKLIIPNGDTVIKEGDLVTVICLLSEKAELERQMRSGGGLFS